MNWIRFASGNLFMIALAVDGKAVGGRYFCPGLDRVPQARD